MKKTSKTKLKKLTADNVWIWIKNNKFTIALILIFLAEIFLRFYQMDQRNPFGWDQVDNAWAAKRLIIQHRYPLVGMVAKQNSGLYIGPAYYYFVSIFYFITNLNPIASEYIALATSIFTFWAIYYFTKKLFNREVALIAVIINTFSFLAINFDRVQWPVNFIPSISLIIFYLLYRILMGEYKKIIYLAVCVGLMFNIHFTAVFFPIIILLTLPFFPRKFETLKYILISIPVFLIFLVPNIIYLATSKSYSSNSSYLGSYYHGFHIRRMIQIINDAYIQFINYLLLPFLDNLRVLILPIFMVVFFKDTKFREKFKFLYLTLLFFLVPWVVFTTYSGESSDYYYAVNRFICLFIISFMLYKIWDMKIVLGKILISLVLIVYCVYNLNIFVGLKDVGLAKRTENVMKEINAGRIVGYTEGVPESYIYYYIMKQRGVIVY